MLWSLVALIPGAVAGGWLFFERRWRKKAEAKLAEMLVEMKELDSLWLRASGKIKAIEAVIRRKDQRIANLEKRLAEADPAALADELFGGMPSSDSDNN